MSRAERGARSPVEAFREPLARRFARPPHRLFLAGTLPLVVTACGRHASPSECSALLDRYVELLVREQDPKAPDTEIARQKELTRAKAQKDSAFASCPAEVSVKSAHCAMSAVKVDEFEKCLE